MDNLIVIVLIAAAFLAGTAVGYALSRPTNGPPKSLRARIRAVIGSKGSVSSPTALKRRRDAIDALTKR